MKHLCFLILLFPAMNVLAGDDKFDFPSWPEAKKRFSAEQGCVEPTDVMRKQHMEFLLHQRDETMHRGIRTKNHSLIGCIDCHADTDAQGEAIAINAPGQFCQSCHEFASVSMDCFQCHATKPARTTKAKHEPIAKHSSRKEEGVLQ